MKYLFILLLVTTLVFAACSSDKVVDDELEGEIFDPVIDDELINESEEEIVSGLVDPDDEVEIGDMI